ncbi:MAG: hypothetical protein NTV94_15840 [Planctomycetota bacterium]|nr:hypothetical protein [Planctomycetota bacterium]
MSQDEAACGVVYTVTAELVDQGVARGDVAWLRGGRLRGGVELGGALEARLVELDAEGLVDVRVQSSYVFANRGKFEAYVRDHAPRLRADGLALFGPSRGARQVKFSRTIGSVLEVIRSG